MLASLGFTDIKSNWKTFKILWKAIFCVFFKLSLHFLVWMGIQQNTKAIQSRI